MSAPYRPSFVFAGRNAGDLRVFRQIVTGMGGRPIHTVKAALELMCDGRVDALIVADDVDVGAVERIIELARRVDPMIPLVYVCRSRRSVDSHTIARAATAIVEREDLARDLAAAISDILHSRDGDDLDEVPLPLSTQRVVAAPVARLAADYTADILLVDDDLALLRMMDRTLRSAGYTTMTAPNPGFVLEVLRSTRFLLLILDVSMPLQNGIDLAREIRVGNYGPVNRDVPLLFVTADDRERTYEDTFDVSALRCLIKPFDPEHLRHIVQSLVYRAA